MKSQSQCKIDLASCPHQSSAIPRILVAQTGRRPTDISVWGLKMGDTNSVCHTTTLNRGATHIGGDGN